MFADNMCRGLGAGIAVLLAKRGANVVINYVSPGSEARAEEVAQQVRKAGTEAVVVRADLGKLDDIPKVVDAALQISQNGKIDILIHKYVYLSAWGFGCGVLTTV